MFVVLVAVAEACAASGDGGGSGGNDPLGTGGDTSGTAGRDGAAGKGDDGGGGIDDTNPASTSSGSGSTRGVSSSGGSSSGGRSTSGSSSGSASSSSSSSSGTGTVPDNGGTTPTMLPAVNGSCPTFAAGSGSTVTISAGGGSIQAQVWAGSPTGGGPLILYWHGTASSPQGEIPISFDTAAVSAAGGLIVGFNANSRTGATTGNTGDAVWYQSDAAFADQTVACAIQQYKIDPRHIHTAGYSAGGLQTVYMWYARSGYIASVISYSGGDAIINKANFQDPSNVAAAIAAHGAMGSDALGLDFAQASATWEGEIKMGGGFSIDCNDGGSHLDFFTKRAPPLKPVAWQFFKDHPFKVKPEPYTSLPSGFPSYCKID
jgi:predicted esterase